jgi:hypothetical protein
MTFGEALKIHQQNQADDLRIKRSTRHYWNQIFLALLKSWPDLAGREIRRVTRTDCKEWAPKFRKVASPTRYNNTISGLRHVFNVAKDAGIIYGNPGRRTRRRLVFARLRGLAAWPGIHWLPKRGSQSDHMAGRKL